MILSPSLDSRQGDQILKPLIDGGFKVLAVTPDLPFLLKNTLAESWFNELKSGRQDPGSITLSYNLSNLIRLAILYKYGGVYLDVDFIVLRDFIGLQNAIGAQSISSITKKWTRINGAAMILNEGHPILYDFLEEFAATFDGSKWGHNGPYLISRVIQRVENKPGYNITILPPKTFYPMDWIKVARYFKKPCPESEQKWVEYMLIELERSTYAIHIWSHQTKELAVEDGSVVRRLISAHCVICHQRNLLTVQHKTNWM
ncbi:lactosylceramide 4-alpha-galactosyltransferase-like [Hibiscus syriacus]|uniref:lactosylceramide 4-alpha-galactosyltransferase-like n=1 Tax=Hibiscus syriacus TaxID=106335 RepID=UPI001921E8B6|nr:lactosylceramide 4-alpha-galactosyltransferase-like [Hibiscus syriacus]